MATPSQRRTSEDVFHETFATFTTDSGVLRYSSRVAQGHRTVSAADCSDVKVTEIFVCPSLEDPMEVLGVLLHELVHAAVGVKAGHGEPFKRVAHAVGLEGPAKSCLPDEACRAKLQPILDKLGTYPHRRLKKTKEKVKKPTKKRVKLMDPENEAYVVSVEEEIIEQFGVPLSPKGLPMEPKKGKSEDA